MRTKSTTWSAPVASHPSATLHERWAAAAPRTRMLLLAAAFLAIALLWSFYAVVVGAVHRGEHGRELARLDVERQAACSVFTAPASRDLCLVTVASRAAPGAVVHAFYERPVGAMHRTELRAGL